MRPNQNEFVTNFDKASEILSAIEQPIDYKALALKRKKLAQEAFNVPKLNKTLEEIEETGSAINNAGEHISGLQHTSFSEHMAQGFHMGELFIASLEFFRIPLVYLTAYILNRKAPVSLSNNARWLYSACLLGLTVSALLFPVAAPVIAFVAAGLVFSASGFLLIKTLFHRYQLNHEKNKLHQKIIYEEDKMGLIQGEAAVIHDVLRKATDEACINEMVSEVAQLNEQYEVQKESITVIKEKELSLNQKIKTSGTLKVVDKSIALVLASLSTVGLVLTLFFPPIGFAMLSGVGLAGCIYFVGRVVLPLLKSLANALMIKIKGKSLSSDESTPNTVNTTPDLNSDNDALAATDIHLHESTTDVLVGLIGREQLKHDPAKYTAVLAELDAENVSIPQSYPTLTPTSSSEPEDDEQEGETEGEKGSERPELH
ncbi:MAG TPA: hypothetical protein PK657_11380 [Legionella sp.]|nr:hypothetical protein [Legionella sp.]